MVSNHRCIHDCPETENQLSTGSFLQSIHLFLKFFNTDFVFYIALHLIQKELNRSEKSFLFKIAKSFSIRFIDA